MNKKAFFFLFISLFVFPETHAQLTMNDKLFTLDRKVDNAYISRYSRRESNLFVNFGGIDAAYYPDGDYYFGCGIERNWGCIIYFDSKIHSKMLGVNFEAQKSFLYDIGKVAVTSKKYVFAAKKEIGAPESIYYWNIANNQYQPEGKLAREYPEILDICKDADDCVYILYIGAKKTSYIEKYDSKKKTFVDFRPGRSAIDLAVSSALVWQTPNGIEVNGNGIYVVFSSGLILKYNAEGYFVKKFQIDETNLGLLPVSPYNSSEPETLLTSITSDASGNVYVLDKNAATVHVFSRDLNYLCSWQDEARPIDRQVTDISFIPKTNNVIISYQWGFYSYVLNADSVSLNIDHDFIYPDCVSGDYKGLNVEISSLRNCTLDAHLTANCDQIKIIDKMQLALQNIMVSWNGRDTSGAAVPYGEYSLQFIIDNRLCKEYVVKVKAPPRVSILNNAVQVLRGTASLAYNYRVTGDGILEITVSKPREN